MVSLKLQHLLASTEWRNQSDVMFDHIGSHIAIRAVIQAQNDALCKELVQMKGKTVYRFSPT